MPRFAPAAVLAAGLAALAAPVPAKAQTAPQHFSGVVVDVGPLRASGLGPFAEAVRSDLAVEAQKAFADRIGGPGPRLVVRITGVSLRSFAGQSPRGGGFGGALENDYMEGEALIVGPRGEILARHPQLSVTPSDSGGAWYDPGSERRRVTALAFHYAQWLRRAL